VLDGGPNAPWEGAILRAVSVVGSDEPKESCVRWESLQVLTDVAMTTNFGTQFAI